MKINRIEKFNSFFDLISECAPELLDVVSDEMKSALNGFDDYESIVYYVINGELVYAADSINGDTTGRAVNIREFFFQTVAYCVDLI